jgi:arginyl-tRNA synthetase
MAEIETIIGRIPSIKIEIVSSNRPGIVKTIQLCASFSATVRSACRAENLEQVTIILAAIAGSFHEIYEAAKIAPETFATTAEITVIMIPTTRLATTITTIVEIATKKMNQIFPGIKPLSVFLQRILWSLRVIPA